MSFMTAKKIGSDKKEFIHINLKNIGFFKLDKSDKSDKSEEGLILQIKYRKKATEKIIKIKSPHDKEGFRKFIFKYNFYLLEEYFININSIDFVDEENIDETDSSSIKIHFYFKDGQDITVKTKKTRWEDWRKLRLN